VSLLAPESTVVYLSFYLGVLVPDNCISLLDPEGGVFVLLPDSGVSPTVPDIGVPEGCVSLLVQYLRVGYSISRGTYG
jgi:hypothetical protein